MSGFLMLMDLPPEVCGHVAVAIRHYRFTCIRNNIRAPSHLVELEQLLSQRAIARPEATELEQFASIAESEAMSPLLLTAKQAARRLLCSERTLQRRVAAGQLAPVRNGRIVRFRVTDIDAVINETPRSS